MESTGVWLIEVETKKGEVRLNRPAFYKQTARCVDCGDWITWQQLWEFNDENEVRARHAKRYKRCAPCASLEWAAVQKARKIKELEEQKHGVVPVCKYPRYQ